MSGSDPRETHDCAAPRWIENFERKAGGNYFEIALMLWMFVGMAVVIDQRFVPAIQDHLSRANMPQGIMGATFLSFANASPEIFISIMSTATTGRVSEGLGAVVGAVVFNLLVVSGVCVLLAPGQKYTLSGDILKRDVPFFCVVLLITVAIFANNMAGLTESLLLFLCYPAYMAYLYMSSSNEGLDPLMGQSSYQSIADSEKGDDEEDKKHSSLAWRWGVQFLYQLTRPWQALFTGVFQPSLTSSFTMVFVMCICSIMVLSAIVLALVKRVVCGLDLNGEMVGLTLLGIGLTVPNTLSNGLISKQGYTDMALSSCLNSNVAGILLGMAGPWTVLNLVNGNPVKLSSPEIKSSFLFLTAATLIFVVSIMASGNRVTAMHGYGYIFLYLVFLTLIVTGAFNHTIV